MTTEEALRERVGELEEQLERLDLWRRDAEAQARLAADVKRQFLSSMSHELRTPLNGLVGASELVLQLDLAEEAREYAQLIHRSALALNEVVGGVMDLARLEAGDLVLRAAVFDARAAIAATVAQHAPAAAGRELALTAPPADGTPLPVVGDEFRFRQVLGHLVGNAIKFTHTGSVAVTLHARARPAGTCEMTICVRDTGIGIRPEDLERIFTMFAQADGSASRAYGGAGLGLAVCQGLAQLMGGALGVSSVHGRGATFIFRIELPVPVDVAVPNRSVAAAAGREPVAGREPGRPGADCPVLLAEDNEVNRALAGRILARAGCRVEIAENGAVALQMARERSYAVIFMDVQMPVMDGLQATRAIRAHEAGGPRVPIIAVTANAMPGDREACFAAGMDDYLAKPLRPHELVAALARWAIDVAQPA